VSSPGEVVRREPARGPRAPTRSSSSASVHHVHLVHEHEARRARSPGGARRMCSPRPAGIGPSAADTTRDRPVHLRRPGDHVSSRSPHGPGPVPRSRSAASSNSYSTCAVAIVIPPLPRSSGGLVDLVEPPTDCANPLGRLDRRDRRGQRRLPMIDVPDRPHVSRAASSRLELCLGHDSLSLVMKVCLTCVNGWGSVRPGDGEAKSDKTRILSRPCYRLTVLTVSTVSCCFRTASKPPGEESSPQRPR